MKTNASNKNKKPNTGLHKEYFRDGGLSSVGKYLNGKRTGVWRYYLRNGKLKAVGKFADGQFTGLWKWFRENGKPLQVGKFENGKQVGLWKRYHPNGKLYDVGKFVDGKRSGEWKIYNRSRKAEVAQSSLGVPTLTAARERPRGPQFALSQRSLRDNLRQGPKVNLTGEQIY